MKSHYTPAHLAEGAIKRSIARLANKYLFHTKVLEQFRLTAAPPVGTMGVTASNHGVLLLHNPEFVLSLPTEHLTGVLLHEVHHVVLGHLTVKPADFPDQWALTVALEVSANEFIREPLPPGGIHLDQFPMLPPMESFARRYERLEQIRDRFELLAGISRNRVGVVFDNHDVWQDGFSSLQATQHSLAALVHQAAVDAGEIPDELLQVAADIGSTPGNVLQTLRNTSPGSLNWKQLLRRYAGRALKPRAVFCRPPRRFPDLLGIFPGRRRAPGNLSVVAVIDTSGSIDSQCLEEIDGELCKLSRCHPVHVVECDREVQRCYRYRSRLQDVQGRGGTDFRPALDPVFLRPLRPGLIVYFTDGLGEAPLTPPPWHLIWCLTPGGETPASYGRVIQMSAFE